MHNFLLGMSVQSPGKQPKRFLVNMHPRRFKQSDFGKTTQLLKGDDEGDMEGSKLGLLVGVPGTGALGGGLGEDEGDVLSLVEGDALGEIEGGFLT